VFDITCQILGGFTYLVRFGLQFKLTLLIVALIGAVIGSLAFYVAREKKQVLTDTASATARKELASLAFIASRAILDRDDLALADSLQNAQGLPGFAVGAVYTPAKKAPLISRVGKTLGEKQKDIERDALETVRGEWEKMFGLQPGYLAENRKTPAPKETKAEKDKKPQVQNSSVATAPELLRIVEKPFLGSKSIKVQYFHKAVFHPFIKVNPPLLAVAQVAVTDEYINRSIRESFIELAVVGAGFFLAALLAAYVLSRFIVKPVKVLSKGAADVAGGNLDVTLPPLGSDELGALAKQFNTMTASLKRASAEAKEQAIFNDQVKQAQEIQEGMNPQRFLKKPEYQIKGFTRAAKGVGGDYYDFQLMADGRIAVLISDVSGKGISASLVMVLIKTVVSTYLRLFNTLRGDTILRTINRVMCAEAHIDKFATILFYIFDPLTKEVEFSNGGHGPIFIYRADRKVCTTSKLEGLPMGIEEDNVYRLSKLTVAKDDIILLYTDGISECWNTAKEEFGLKRIRQKIVEYAHMNPKEIIEKLVHDLDEFAAGAEQHDDMTMVVMKVL
jgi:serine phosphatase RsbU (regulator of sigma subunit)